MRRVADAHESDAQAPWVLYVLRCRGGRLYCGITNDLARRWAAHIAGKGAHFTRGFPPEAIVASLHVGERAEALRRESAFKRLTKRQKLEALREWPAGKA